MENCHHRFFVRYLLGDTDGIHGGRDSAGLLEQSADEPCILRLETRPRMGSAASKHLRSVSTVERFGFHCPACVWSKNDLAA